LPKDQKRGSARATNTLVGKCFLQMLSVFAEFETNLRKERQMEGIKKAKEKGLYKGRKKSIDVDQVRKLKDEGMGATAISKLMGISRKSVYNSMTSLS
jgi:DNA invertase Pin-like site-specific DNA recombinase